MDNVLKLFASFNARWPGARTRHCLHQPSIKVTRLILFLTFFATLRDDISRQKREWRIYIYASYSQIAYKKAMQRDFRSVNCHPITLLQIKASSIQRTKLYIKGTTCN